MNCREMSEADLVEYENQVMSKPPKFASVYPRPMIQLIPDMVHSDDDDCTLSPGCGSGAIWRYRPVEIVVEITLEHSLHISADDKIMCEYRKIDETFTGRHTRYSDCREDHEPLWIRLSRQREKGESEE